MGFEKKTFVHINVLVLMCNIAYIFVHVNENEDRSK
jgi:hypothetical protein